MDVKGYKDEIYRLVEEVVSLDYLTQILTLAKILHRKESERIGLSENVREPGQE